VRFSGNFDQTGFERLTPSPDATAKRNFLSVTADGEPFRNIEEFRKILLKDSDQLARYFTERLIVYSTGAGIGFADRPVVERIISRTESKNHGVRAIIHAIVQSSVFQSK
jgi:hypothetical protein